MEKFVYDLAAVQYNPKGTGIGHGNGYQPYAKWVSNRLNANIEKYGKDLLATFDAAAMQAVESLMATLASEKASLSSDNKNAQDSLDAKTAELIAGLVNTRENTEMVLQDWQSARESADMESRDMDQIALVTTKNNCWKELSWIIRKTHSGYPYGQGGNSHEHGLSAGPVYGYINKYAQRSVPFDPDYTEPHGYGTEGKDDGYDPYGYGDFGYGYGYAQTQYKEVQEKLK